MPGDPGENFPNLLAAEPVFPPVRRLVLPRRLLYLALIVLVTLISLVAFQLRSKDLENQTRQEQAAEKQAREGLDAAKKLTGLNDNLARQILVQTKKNLKDQKLKNVLAEIDKQLAIVGHVYQVSNLDVFSDFSLLRAEAKISSAGLNANQIVVLDNKNGAVYSLGTKSKTAAIIGGMDDFKNDASVDFTADKTYVATSNGLYFLSLVSLKAASVDFGRVVSWGIDGSIWILSQSGNLVKLSGGSPEDFNISGLDDPLQNPVSLFVTDETNNIYILDQNRVVVLDKKGVYQAQYLLSTINYQLSAIILADETVKKVFLFSGSKVYSFDLK
ncbi:hypothetical protein HY085_01320 [Candidatus Gottesmanbacteria bacterium]|nr:hypothetical protein [Candidatus Gottesmanbacteria bacterium]